jgi:hypothetical protein
MPAITTLDQVPLALGYSRRYLTAGIVRSIGTIFCIAIGALSYGIIGLAIGVVIANIITFIPFFSICTKNSPILAKKYFQMILIPFSLSLIFGIGFYFLKSTYPEGGLFFELSCMSAYFTSLSMVILVCDFYQYGIHLGIADTLIKKIKLKKSS